MVTENILKFLQYITFLHTLNLYASVNYKYSFKYFRLYFWTSSIYFELQHSWFHTYSSYCNIHSTSVCQIHFGFKVSYLNWHQLSNCSTVYISDVSYCITFSVSPPIMLYCVTQKSQCELTLHKMMWSKRFKAMQFTEAERWHIAIKV